MRPAPPAPQPPEKPRLRSRLLYRFKTAAHEPTAFLGLLLTIIFLIIVIAPIVSIASDAFRVQFGDQLYAHQPVGSWTGYYLWRTFRASVSEVIFWKPLIHTLTIAFGATAVSLIVGGSMGWLVTRTNMPGRKWLATALVVPFMMPSWTFALAWLTVFKNRKIGGQLGYLETAGFHPPNWLAYGPLPIIVCLGVHYSPFVLLLFGNALRRLDSQLEDSARILGAPRWTVARRVVLPLMLPALSSAILLTFAKMLGTFGTPYILGLPVNYSVLSTTLFTSINNEHNGMAAVLTLVITAIGIGVLFLDSRLSRQSKRFVTVGGKGSMGRTTNLRRWRLPAFGIAFVVFFASVLAPLAALFLSTVTKTPGKLNPGNFTALYWIGNHASTPGFPHGLLRGTELYKAAWNSVRVVGIASIVCAILGLLVGYVVVRTSGTRMSGFLRQVSFLPYLVPGIAFAAAYITLFAVPRGPVPALYGTLALLIIVLAVTHLPYSSRSGISAMMQLGRDPEEAAQVCGARWHTRMRRVVMPIQKGALVTGIVLPFISGMKELSVVIMLTTSGTQLLTTLSINLVDDGYTQLSNAAVLVIAVVTFGMTYIVQKLTGSNLASGLGGGR
jgi:iron(III) transport system permease protein